MKKWVAFALMVVLAIASPAAVSAAAPGAVRYDRVVVGTGNPDVDVPAVQAAVDAGGKILLKGTFDFGDMGTVLVLTDDVEIYGQKVGKEFKTRIVGGGVPFFVGSETTDIYRAGTDPTAPYKTVRDVSIQDVSFENPMMAIAIISCQGQTRIVGNKIVDGRPLNFFGFPQNGAIVANTWWGFRLDPTLIRGTITIAHNYIDARGRSWATQAEAEPGAVQDGDGGRWYRGLMLGIHVSHVEAETAIVGNTILNTPQEAITLSILGSGYKMKGSITGNVARPSPTEMYGQSLLVEGAQAYVAHNTFYDQNPGSWGVQCSGCYDSVFEENDTYHNNGVWGGISFDTFDIPASGNIVRNNRITGQGPAAILFTRDPGYQESMHDNVVAMNDLTGFTPTDEALGMGAHILVTAGAVNNRFVLNRFSTVDPNSSSIANVLFTDGTEGNVLLGGVESGRVKYIDWTNTATPPAYNGKNIIGLKAWLSATTPQERRQMFGDRFKHLAPHSKRGWGR